MDDGDDRNDFKPGEEPYTGRSFNMRQNQRRKSWQEEYDAINDDLLLRDNDNAEIERIQNEINERIYLKNEMGDRATREQVQQMERELWGLRTELAKAKQSVRDLEFVPMDELAADDPDAQAARNMSRRDGDPNEPMLDFGEPANDEPANTQHWEKVTKQHKDNENNGLEADEKS